MRRFHVRGKSDTPETADDLIYRSSSVYKMGTVQCHMYLFEPVFISASFLGSGRNKKGMARTMASLFLSQGEPPV